MTLNSPGGSRDKAIKDTAWHLLSFAIQMAAGFALTVGLYFVYGPEPLGRFNQLYAIFLVSGQLFIFGVNESALKHAAEFQHDETEINRMTVSLLLWGGITGFLGAAGVAIYAITIGAYIYSPSVQEGILWMAPGVALYVTNKNVLFVHIGRQEFQRFSILQSIRGILLVCLVFYVVTQGRPHSMIGLCFTVTEAVLLMAQTPTVMHFYREHRRLSRKFWDLGNWMRQHILFGGMSMPQSLMSVSLIRIDILVLSFFVDDASIGTYSLAAFFFEGAYQVPAVIRNITNPRLVHIFKDRDREAFKRLIRFSGGLSFGLSLVLIIALIILLPPAMEALAIVHSEQVATIIQIILVGLLINAPSIPFDQALMQGGRPGQQSIYMAFITSINVVANIIFIKLFGLVGAASATTLTMILAGPALWISIEYYFKISKWPSRAS